MSFIPSRPTLPPLTVLSTSDDQIPSLTHHYISKHNRSYSTSSAQSAWSFTTASSTTTTYSRSADDMIEKLASQEPHSLIDLWSGGNVRLNGRDLTLTTHHAEDLLHAMRDDDRFEFIRLTFFDTEGEDWKISFRRSKIVNTAFQSDFE
ncbi:hypothetical protein IAR55_005173 [Kwoniella newhampshirensis]|uniref:Uncharacterized protein n=1 Tax=Kwoniella newhampshirensis TaxID=1651941 RepID=A0AAW0YJ33_9TREE